MHVAEGFDLTALVDEVPPYSVRLAEAYLPGPLTMIYPSKGHVSPLVTAGGETLAVRVPSSPCAQAFLRAVGCPIAAPSANLSKHVSPVTAEHVKADFDGWIPLILDGGKSEGGIESTVLDCTREVPVILREGLVTREMIARVAGSCLVHMPIEGEKPKSPGMAYRHYMPRCRTAYAKSVKEALDLLREEKEHGGRPAVLCEHVMCAAFPSFPVYDLGETDGEMASLLYLRLREAEDSATLLIALEPKLHGGCMAGVMNRLRRAFGGRS